MFGTIGKRLFAGVKKGLLTPVSGSASRYGVRELSTGAWQRPVSVADAERALSFHAVFACVTLIAGDIAKLRLKQVRQGPGGVWSEVEPAKVEPVLVKPNSYQNRIQFWESWFLSKLTRGNAYALKVRGSGGKVIGLHVLDPNRVRPLVAPDGAVFYELRPDNMAGLGETVTVPARELIHDRFNCLFHPLVGIAPLYAAGLAATQGLAMQETSAALFGNAAMPAGILTAPGEISAQTAAELKAAWESGYSGANRGKTAVLGDDMKFQALAVNAVDAQLIDQLRWTAEVVCAVYHVPPYKAGVGAVPSYNNVQALNVEYFTQSLQGLIEAAELCIDEGLSFAPGVGVEFDVSGLLRMDSAALVAYVDKARNVMTLDERRALLDLAPVKGGATLYLQQQDHSLEAIAARDRDLIAQAARLAAEDAARPADELPDLDAAAKAFRKGLSL